MKGDSQLMQGYGLIILLDVTHDERETGGQEIIAVELDGVAIISQDIAHQNVDETDAAGIVIIIGDVVFHR